MFVFDWDKAAQIIKERGIKNARAGLCGDYANTEGVILRDGEPVYDSYTYLASVWACPMLLVYDDEDSFQKEEIQCYVSDADDAEYKKTWNAKTKWPNSALTTIGFGGENGYSED